jgi:hypothetical protein
VKVGWSLKRNKSLTIHMIQMKGKGDFIYARNIHKEFKAIRDLEAEEKSKENSLTKGFIKHLIMYDRIIEDMGF